MFNNTPTFNLEIFGKKTFIGTIQFQISDLVSNI
jgi:hypothetical protein